MTIITNLRDRYANLASKGMRLEPIALLLARIVGARVFFMSGKTKWNGFLDFNPDKYDLFKYEFFCPEEPRAHALVLCKDAVEGTYAPTTAWIVERLANMAGIMEITLPVLLVLGLFSRAAALGLLMMTLFIQFFVYPDMATWWGSHAWWAAALLVVLARGPGWLSVDRWLGLERGAEKSA